jgi:hypothetical protein
LFNVTNLAILSGQLQSTKERSFFFVKIIAVNVLRGFVWRHQMGNALGVGNFDPVFAKRSQYRQINLRAQVSLPIFGVTNPVTQGEFQPILPK